MVTAVSESVRPVGRRNTGILAALVTVQAILFYDHSAVSLTLLIALGIGVRMRDWKAGFTALAVFALSFALAVVTGWLDDARPADALLGAALSFLGGLTGGGLFTLLRAERPSAEPPGVVSVPSPARTARIN